MGSKLIGAVKGTKILGGRMRCWDPGGNSYACSAHHYPVRNSDRIWQPLRSHPPPGLGQVNILRWLRNALVPSGAPVR